MSTSFNQILRWSYLACHLDLLKEKARPAGFEPATYGLEVRCSIQLSYGRVFRGSKYNTPAKFV